MLSTIGSVAVVFAVGAIAVWGPQYVFLSRKIQDDSSKSVDEYKHIFFFNIFLFNYYKKFVFCFFHSISLMFGIVTIVAGVLGVVAGSFMGQKLRVRFPSVGKIFFVSFWKFTFRNYLLFF